MNNWKGRNVDMDNSPKLDYFQAESLRLKEEALMAYQAFLANEGEFKKYIDNAGVDRMIILSGFQDKYPKYQKLKEDIVFHIGQELSKFNVLAKRIKTFLEEPKYQYWYSWRMSSQMSYDHPDRPYYVEYCEEYRNNEPCEACIQYYKVGDEVTSSQYKGYFVGKIIAIHDNMMDVELKPNNKSRKEKKIVTVPTDSLNFFPSDWTPRKDDKSV